MTADPACGGTSRIVAGVSLAGLLVTFTLLPEPKSISLEELTETGADHVNMAPAVQSQSATLPRFSAKL